MSLKPSEETESLSYSALPVASLPPSITAYAELHCISNFTFLRGASFPEELVETAFFRGYSAISITDECTLSGVVRAHMAAKKHGIRLIIGAEFKLEEDCHLVILVSNRVGYGELSHLITCARREAKKGVYRIDRLMIEANLPKNCLVLWVPGSGQPAEAIASELVWLDRLFPQRLWIAVELLLRGDDRFRLQKLQRLGKQFGIPLCAAGGVYMHNQQRRILQDTVTAIRLGKLIAELGFEGEGSGQRHLRAMTQLAKLYPPELLEETVIIAGRCNFSLDELRYEYPQELVPTGYTPHGWLRELTERGIRQRWPRGASPKVRNIIEHELILIRELHYEHYFLTVHDLVAFARKEHILCQGRGSAANSAVCYCLGITEVDPDRVAVLFERCISRERDEPPDIDVDFENARREEMIQYIYNKYGRGRAALVATVITYQPRSVIRDVGKVLGLEKTLIEHLAKSVYWWGSDLEEQLSDSDIDYSDPQIQRLIYLSRALIGFPRHLSQHVGGFIISQGPLSHLVPIENAAMVDRTVIQWEKGDLESLGLLKIDVLALGMLTAIQKCLKLVSDYSDEELTIQKIPPEDPKVYDMMGEADTVGVFQIESRAQMSMLPRLKPRNYYDLVIQVAIVRPGPIQGDMVHPYLARRCGKEEVSYPSEEVRATLERTLGVPIFQEQVMQLAMVAAGFSGGEADQLRRAMAAWKRKGGLEPYRDKLINGMLERGYERGFAEQLFRQIQGFGDYGFPESHSASFALISYISSWLKYYHPASFCCALLNSQPMGFYAPAQLIKDAQKHGVKVLPVDVNSSFYDCTLEQPKKPEAVPGHECALESLSLRIGFNQVKGFSEVGGRAIAKAREARWETRGEKGQRLFLDPLPPGQENASKNIGQSKNFSASSDTKGKGAGRFYSDPDSFDPGSFVSVQDLVFRSGINKKNLEALAAADALRELSGDRHRAFWFASGVETVAQRKGPGASQSAVSLFDDSDSDFGVDVLLPVASESQNVIDDYTATGFTLRRHPLALLRNHLDNYQITRADTLGEIENEGFAKVAGIVTCRQRPMTASGVTFITMEDESGFVNVVVWPGLGEKQRPVVRQAKLLGVTGHVQHSDGVTHLIAQKLVDLTHWLGAMTLPSRDFT